MITPHELAWLNALPPEDAERELLACCGSTRWANAVAARRPYRETEELLRVADDVWWSLDEGDWLEAFSHHPRIGESAAPAPAGERAEGWSASEQAGMRDASATTADELARLNDEYVNRFGYTYIVCATGKSADEMLAILRARLANDATREVRAAAEEQRKISRLRLEKLLRLHQPLRPDRSAPSGPSAPPDRTSPADPSAPPG